MTQIHPPHTTLLNQTALYLLTSTLSRFTLKADRRVTPGCKVPVEQRRVFLRHSIWKSGLWGSSLQMQTNRRHYCFGPVKTKGVSSFPRRFINSVSPISSNGYHREWLGEMWSHNEAQIITTSPIFARALSLSRSASLQLPARQTVSLFYIKGLDKREKEPGWGRRSRS